MYIVHELKVSVIGLGELRPMVLIVMIAKNLFATSNILL